MNVEKEQELRDLYYDPVNGYRSREKLYQKAIEKGLKISRREVKEWLETQDTYTIHKPVVRKHKFQKTYVKELADQIQLDLVYRKDTKNMTDAVEKLLEEFKVRFDERPNVVQFDEGREFYNVGVKTLLENNNIKYFSTQSDKKAAIYSRKVHQDFEDYDVEIFLQ